MKKRNEAHQVRGNDSALDMQKHKRPFLGMDVENLELIHDPK